MANKIEMALQACADWGLIPTSFRQCMTWEEQVLWLYKFINEQIVPTTNQLIDDFNALKEWVENYLDSVDFQTIVNEKLDEMAEDGTLAELINQEIFGELNDRVQQNTEDIAALEEKPDFAQVNVTQTIIYDWSGVQPVQGICVSDDNKLYQYVSPADGNNGTLYIFDLLNHEYLSSIENVPLFHGNDLCWKDGEIWSACLADGENNSTKVAKYNPSTGTSAVYNPFTSLGYSRSFGICDNGANSIIVGMYKIDGTTGYNLNQLAFCKLNTNTMSFDEYTIDLKHMYPGYGIPTGIERVGNKLYMLCGQHNYLISFDIDDANSKITADRVRYIGETDDIGLVFGEMEGFTKLPSEYYGKETFVIGSFMLDDNATSSTAKYYYCNPMNDLKKYFSSWTTSNYHMRIKDIHVQKAPINGKLLENGTSDRPFKKLNRAIEFASNNKLGNRIGDIYIDDSETYNIGQCAGVSVRIRTSQQPTISFYRSTIKNSKIMIQNTNANILQVSMAEKLTLTNSEVTFVKCKLTRQIEATASILRLIECELDLAGTPNHAILGYMGSDIRLYITGSPTGYTGKICVAYGGCVIECNNAIASECVASTGAYLLASAS